jgi:hypothetical protein
MILTRLLGCSSGGIDSDVEDAMLSRLYYTSSTKGMRSTNESNDTKESIKSKADSSPQSSTQHGQKRTYDLTTSSDSGSEEGELNEYAGSPNSDNDELYGDESRQASCEEDSDDDYNSDDNSIVFTPAKEDDENDIPVTKIIDLEQPVELDDDVKDTDEYAYMDNAAFQVNRVQLTCEHNVLCM